MQEYLLRGQRSTSFIKSRGMLYKCSAAVVVGRSKNAPQVDDGRHDGCNYERVGQYVLLSDALVVGMIPRRQTLGYYEFDASEEGKSKRHDNSPSQSLICAQRREENRAHHDRDSGASVVRVEHSEAGERQASMAPLRDD